MSEVPAKRVLVLAQLDRFANGVKPLAIARYLTGLGHRVLLVDTYYLSRAGTDGRWRRRLPRPSLRGLALFLVEGAFVVLTRSWGLGRRTLSYPLLVAMFWLRRGILRRSLPPLDSFDLVVCEQPFDADVLRDAGSTPTLYDCPTPFADELRDERRLTPSQHQRMRAREIRLLNSVDHLSYWWTSYARYVTTHYGISGHNLMTLNYGCEPSPTRAQFAVPPRIAYLGSLSSVFINLDLLAELARRYPHIDVYGGPPPDPALGLNYLGPAEPDVLLGYQAGLITCTDDELRRHGFSAKHLQYLAYGLPVLVPAWRRHGDLPAGSLHYDLDTFCHVVDRLADREQWQATSDAAYSAAQSLRWERTLQPLTRLLDHSHRAPDR